MARPHLIRLLCASLAVLLTAPFMAGSSPTAGSEHGEVVFRLTLEGPVPATHSFAISCGSIDPGAEFPCFGETISIACISPENASPFHASDACTARTYEVIGQVPAGQTIEYALLHWTTSDLSHTAEQPEVHLAGSWQVHEGRQLISLGYVYPGGTDARVLSDTAMKTP